MSPATTWTEASQSGAIWSQNAPAGAASVRILFGAIVFNQPGIAAIDSTTWAKASVSAASWTEGSVTSTVWSEF